MNDWSSQHNNATIFMALHASFPHASSGYAVRSHSIATSLAAHGVQMYTTTRPGFPWSAKNETPSTMEDTVDGIVYHRIFHGAPEIGNSGEYYRLMSRHAYAQALKNCGASLIHAASSMETGLPAMQAAQDCNIPGVYEYRGMWHYTRQSRFPWHMYTDEFTEYHNLELQTGHEAAAVISISEALRDDLVLNGLDAAKISVLPNAVDTSLFHPLEPDADLLDALNLHGRKVVGFIGSVTAYEGLDRLIDAVLELNAAGEKVSFVLVGDGAAINGLQAHHAVRGAHPSIIFTGRVPFEEVTRYYSIMDIMAFPRINAKVCHCVPPLKPLEAMAMCKPVVVSDVAALCEMVHHEETGLVCRADDTGSLVEQLGRLVSDSALFHRLTENALQWVRDERDWRIVGKRLLRVYESVL